MRLKNVKGSREKIEAHENTIQTDGADGADYAGKWKKEIFKNDHPLHIEIGMGKGQFILEMAEKHPEINFIGIEKFSSVLVRAIEKLDCIKEKDNDIHNGIDNVVNKVEDKSHAHKFSLPYKNVIFMRMDAENIDKYFAPKEIDCIYLNFSDPWPKKRHEKRRLTSDVFLEKYKRIMNNKAVLIFKTDNEELFDFSVKELKNNNWKLLEITTDLHKNGPAQDNVMTEYERKFYGLHKKIMRLKAENIE